MDFKTQLVDFEGWRHEAYPDPLTMGAPWTIGVGHTGPEVKRGLKWDTPQIEAALEKDAQDAIQDCREAFPWFDGLNEARQAVIAGMRFQMGLRGLLTFKDTLGLVRDERFMDAAEHMRRSLWARQTSKRAMRMAKQMELGSWA